jgi:hypothetical protein
MPFVAIGIDSYVEMHIRSNRDDKRETFRAVSSREAPAAASHSREDPIWVAGPRLMAHVHYVPHRRCAADEDYESVTR